MVRFMDDGRFWRCFDGRFDKLNVHRNDKLNVHSRPLNLIKTVFLFYSDALDNKETIAEATINNCVAVSSLDSVPLVSCSLISMSMKRINSDWSENSSNPSGLSVLKKSSNTLKNGSSNSSIMSSVTSFGVRPS